jgi:hypothetical protein
MEKKFEVISKWKWIYGIYASICFVIFAGMFFIVFSKETTTFQQVCAFPFYSLSSFFLGLLSIYGYFQSIKITSNKISYRMFGYNVEIEWHNIKRIGEYKNLFWKYEGLYLSKSEGTVTVWFLGARFDRSEVFIPLSIFAENWRDADLGQQIKQHAPHLFESAGD